MALLKLPKGAIKPRPAVLAMAPYSPPTGGRAGKLRLDFNENTVGCSPKVIDVLKANLCAADLAVYPEYTAAKQAMARYFQVSPDQFVFTNGTDEAIQVFINTYIDDGQEVLVLKPAYAMYRFYAEVAGAKITVSVVVESTPTNSAGVLRIRRQLIVDAGVAQRMFGKPFHLVDRFGGIGVSDELGVQVARVIGWLQRKSEIVHGENVFEKFRFLKVPDAARLTRGVQLVRQRIRADVEVVVVLRFVNSHAPENDGRMVPVAANHAPHVVN